MTTTDHIEIIDQFPTRKEAEEETAKGRTKTADIARHLLMLRTRGAHIVMGYTTWTEYIEREFGRTYRSAKYLIEFALLLKEIEDRTGVENPPLTEKGTRGATEDDKHTIVGAANKAIEKGEDPHEAIKAAGQKVKEEAKRRPRTQGDGTTGKGRSFKASTTGPPTDEATDDRPSLSELTADDVENAPEHDSPVEPTALPVKLPAFSYEAWRALTLACRDEHGAMMMRENFEDLMTSVDMALYAEDERDEQQSA